MTHKKTYTKVIFELYVKDFPVGKIFMCRRWRRGKFTESDIKIGIKRYIEEYKKLYSFKKKKYNFVGFKILEIEYHPEKHKKDKFETNYIINKRDYTLEDKIPEELLTNDEVKLKKNNIRDILFPNRKNIL